MRVHTVPVSYITAILGALGLDQKQLKISHALVAQLDRVVPS
jgi:hypothetical protein